MNWADDYFFDDIDALLKRKSPYKLRKKELVLTPCATVSPIETVSHAFSMDWVESLFISALSPLPELPILPWKIKDSLLSLSITFCSLTCLPASITQLTKLENIVVCSNLLDDISPLMGCENLRRIAASHNQITFIPNTITNLTNLEELRLSHNRLEITLPLGMSRLKRLFDLRLNDNQLIALPGQLVVHSDQSITQKVFGFSGNPWFNLRKRNAARIPVFCPYSPHQLISKLFLVKTDEEALPFVQAYYYTIYYLNKMVPRVARQRDESNGVTVVSLVELCCRTVLFSLREQQWRRKNLLPLEILHRLENPMRCFTCDRQITDAGGYVYEMIPLGNKLRHYVAFYWPICSRESCAPRMCWWNDAEFTIVQKPTNT